MNDGLRIISKIVAQLFDEDGVEVDRRETTNFFTELGEAYIADRLSDRDEADGDLSHLAVGSGTGQTRTSTTLATETGRVAFDGGYPDQGTGADDNDVIAQADIVAGTATGTVSEGAIFSTTPAGTMVNYWEFSPAIDKKVGNNLVVTVTIVVGDS